MPKRTEKRTQIYLTGEQHERAMRLARRRGGSLAGVVREALTRYLASAEAEDDADWSGDPALELAVAGDLDLPARPPGEELGEFIDRTVYEGERDTWSSPTAPGSSRPFHRAARRRS